MVVEYIETLPPCLIKMQLADTPMFLALNFRALQVQQLFESEEQGEKGCGSGVTMPSHICHELGRQLRDALVEQDAQALNTGPHLQ
jgi:hypothetical protein